MKKVTFEDWISSLVDRIAACFNLFEWDIEVKFPKKEDEDGAYANICVDSRYLRATINFFPMARKDYADKNWKRLLESSVHELVHIFLDPFNDHASKFLSEDTSSFFKQILEQQTVKLTRILMASLPENILELS